MRANWMTWFGVVSIALFIAATTWGTPPQEINYQGRLISGGSPVNGNVAMVLRLYDQAVGGSLLYADSNTVTVVDGLYSTTLGDGTISGTLTNALSFTNVHIEVTVNGTILAPRERLQSVPYAIEALTARESLTWKYNYGSSWWGDAYREGRVSLGLADPFGYQLNVVQIGTNKGAVRAVGGAAECLLGLQKPLALVFVPPLAPSNIAVCAIKHSVGDNGAAVYGWNRDSVNNRNYAG